MKKTYLLLLTLTVFLSSCNLYKKVFHTAKTPFTSRERKQLESNEISLEMVQFYNDKKIILKRTLDSAGTNIKSGEVQLENGKYINYVTLEKETPGKCVSFTDSTVSVTFEEGDNTQLVFMRPPNDNLPYALHTNNGEINYQGSKYRLHVNAASIDNIKSKTKGSKYSSANTGLLIKKNVLYSKKIQKRVMKGQKIK
ncbi:MAG: hypothetical protein WCG87_12910 [Bacteroidota bacterium]